MLRTSKDFGGYRRRRGNPLEAEWARLRRELGLEPVPRQIPSISSLYTDREIGGEHDKAAVTASTAR
jgi:hypothetical protein